MPDQDHPKNMPLTVLRSNRKGSILRREALERLRKQHYVTNHQHNQDTRASAKEEKDCLSSIEKATSSEVQSRAVTESMMSGRRTWRRGKIVNHGLSLSRYIPYNVHLLLCFFGGYSQSVSETIYAVLVNFQSG